MASQVSSDRALMAALQANNPFEKPPVVKEQNIWGDSFPDVASLNAHASNAVFEALAKVRSSDSNLDKVTSIVFIADRGVGKSHIIKRIRKQIQAEGHSLFVYASADKYGDLDLVNCSFQQSVASSLEQLGAEDISQWQEIATLMVSEALETSNSQAKVSSASGLVAKFDTAYQNSRIRGRDLIADLTKAIRRVKPNADAYIVRAILWTLSEERGPLAVKWLAGEQLDAQDALDLRLPPNQQGDKEKEAHALSVVSKILSIAGEYRTVCICFDELDTITANALGFPTATVIADLVRKLFTALQQSEKGKGAVMLTVLLPDIWRGLKQDADVSAKDKVATDGEAINLSNADLNSVTELVSLWLSSFYTARNLIPPTPIYPFEQADLVEYSKGRPYMREVLKWCASYINKKVESFTPEEAKKTPTERFDFAYKNALEQIADDYLDDNGAIASTLSFCFQRITDIDRIKDTPIENVVVKGIEEVTPKSKNSGYINFKLIGIENEEPVTIGIEVLQQTHGLSVGAGFRRLLDYETFGLTRGCLVRSRERKLMRNWDSYEYYQQLIGKGGEWVDLKEDQIKPLLALHYVYEHHEKFDLSIKRLDSFAFVQKLLLNNELIKEILSKPEGALAEDSLEGNELQPLHSEEERQEIAASLSESLDMSSEEEEQLDLEPALVDLEVA
ncbi:MAG: hypothetical protein WBC73_00345 [Phormidesmis sp.]